MSDAPLASATDALGRAADRTLAVLGGEPTEPVSVALFDLPWSDAALALARTTGRRVRALGEVRLLEAPTTVTLQFTDASTRTVLELAGAYAGVGVLVPDDLGSVTLDLKDVPFDEALAALRAVRPLALTRVGEQVVVTRDPLDVDLARLLPELAPAPWGAPSGRVRVEGAPTVAAACAAISVAAGLPVQADLELRLPAPLSLRGAPWRDALALVAALADARVLARGGRVLLVRRPATALYAARAPLGALLEALAALDGAGAPRATLDAPRAVSGTLRGFLPDEAAVALALAAGCDPSRGPDGAWRLTARPLPGEPAGEYVPEQVHTYEPDVPRPADSTDDERRREAVFGGPPPVVQATLVGASGAGAVVDGRVLRPGESLRDARGAAREGLTLVSVSAGVCVFGARGSQVVVEVGP